MLIIRAWPLTCDCWKDVYCILLISNLVWNKMELLIALLMQHNKPLYYNCLDYITVSISSSESITGKGFSVSALSGIFSSIHLSGSSSGSTPWKIYKFIDSWQLYNQWLYSGEGNDRHYRSANWSYLFHLIGFAIQSSHALFHSIKCIRIISLVFFVFFIICNIK